MSITASEQVSCHCGAIAAVDVVHSLNAGRHPHLRSHVLARTLHVYDCSVCGESFCVNKGLVYCDFERRQLLGVFLPADRARERECGELLVELFERHLRANAPAFIRSRANEFLVRICFGYEELREKLVIDDAGLSDLTVEVIKVNLLAAPALRAADVATLRLDAVSETELLFIPEWLDGRTAHQVHRCDRALYDKLHDGHDALRSAYPGIASGPHVSLLRLISWPAS